MMNTMSNNKLNIDELEMVNGGGFWDALVETVGSILDTTKDVVCEYGPVGAYYIFQYIRDIKKPSWSPCYEEQYRR